MQQTMIHYTLNTGHSRESPLSEVDPDVLALMRQFVVPGQHDLEMMPGYSVVVPGDAVTCLMFTVYHGRVPLVTCGVADSEASADEMWPPLEQMYLRLTDKGAYAQVDWEPPRRPESYPWLAVVIDAPTFADWLGDFERCMAWAWLTRNNS